MRRDLKYGDGQTYLPQAQFGSAEWNLKRNGNPINLNVSADLATAMKTNPRLKVMVNGGYYDLATPFYAAYYEDKHLPIPESLAKNIEFDWYKWGTWFMCGTSRCSNCTIAWRRLSGARRREMSEAGTAAC